MSVPDHELGGDPACWAHLFDDDPEEMTGAVVDLSSVEGAGGAVWSLPHGGDLDANFVRLEPGGAIGEHVGDVDVLIVVREGDGELTVDGIVRMLTGSSLVLIPKGSARSLRAGERGIGYLSVHRGREPMTIRARLSHVLAQRGLPDDAMVEGSPGILQQVFGVAGERVAWGVIRQMFSNDVYNQWLAEFSAAAYQFANRRVFELQGVVYRDDIEDRFRPVVTNVTIQNVINTADGPKRYWMRFQDGAVDLEAGDADTPDATIEQDYDTAVALAKSELNPVSAFMSGKIRINGSMMLLMQLQGALSELAKEMQEIDVDY